MPMGRGCNCCGDCGSSSGTPEQESQLLLVEVDGAQEVNNGSATPLDIGSPTVNTGGWVTGSTGVTLPAGNYIIELNLNLELEVGIISLEQVILEVLPTLAGVPIVAHTGHWLLSRLAIIGQQTRETVTFVCPLIVATEALLECTVQRILGLTFSVLVTSGVLRITRLL